MIDDKHLLIIDAAKLYYESNYTQQEIAVKLNISRPTVSRLLNQAKELGYVHIEITNPFEIKESLSTQLKNKYHIDTILICHSPTDTEEEIKNSISENAAQYLHEIVKDDDIIGVTWGTTLKEIATRLPDKMVSNVEIVQLNGGVSYSKIDTFAYEIIHNFTKAFRSIPRYLPLPVLFDSETVKNLVESDRNIQKTMERGQQANIAVFTVGSVKDNARLFRLGYLDDNELQFLQENSVGDICSRFFTKEGLIASSIIDNRTVGIKLDDLRKKEKSILVAGGIRKVPAIHGALVGRYANVLITDQYTAKSLLAF